MKESNKPRGNIKDLRGEKVHSLSPHIVEDKNPILTSTYVSTKVFKSPYLGKNQTTFIIINREN